MANNTAQHWIIDIDLTEASVWQKIGVFPAVLATLISVVHIIRHLRHNQSPKLAWVELKLLFVVPLFCIDSAVSLWYQDSPRKWAMIFTATREFYESVVLVSFVQFLLLFLGRETKGRMDGFRVYDIDVNSALWKCNGTYRVIGRENDRPKFGESTGTGVMHFKDGKWCISSDNEEKVVFQSSDNEKLPPTGEWQSTTAGSPSAKVEKATANPAMTLGDMLSEEPPATSLFQMALHGPYLRGADFVASVLTGILQYVVVMNLVLVTNILLWFWTEEGCALEHPDLFSASWVRQKIEGAANGLKGISCAVALYHLGLIYLETSRNDKTREQLEGINPELKFVMVKGIIFFTFWQGAVIGIFNFLHQIPVGFDFEGHKWCPEYVVEGIKNFLLCWEMLIFAIGHTYAYPAHEFNGWEARGQLEAAMVQGTSDVLEVAIDYAGKCGVKDLSYKIESGFDRWDNDDKRFIVSGHDAAQKKIDIRLETDSSAGLFDSAGPKYPIHLHVREELLGQAKEELRRLKAAGSERRSQTVKIVESAKCVKYCGYFRELNSLYRDVRDLRDFAKRIRTAARLITDSDSLRVELFLGGDISGEEDIRAVFKKLDLDTNGKVTMAEIKSMCARTETTLAKNISEAFKGAAQGDEAVNFTEDQFVAKMTRKGSAQLQDSLSSNKSSILYTAFKTMDRSGNNAISSSELTHVLIAAHAENPKEFAKQAFERIDKNDDKTISFEEFRSFITIGLSKDQKPGRGSGLEEPLLDAETP